MNAAKSRSNDRPAFTDAMTDVAMHFDSPEAVLTAREFDREQKIALLRQWDTDLRLLMVATEENMPPEGSDRTGDQLRLVQAALSTLGADGDHDAPTKTGS